MLPAWVERSTDKIPVLPSGVNRPELIAAEIRAAPWSANHRRTKWRLACQAPPMGAGLSLLWDRPICSRGDIQNEV